MGFRRRDLEQVLVEMKSKVQELEDTTNQDKNLLSYVTEIRKAIDNVLSQL